MNHSFSSHLLENPQALIQRIESRLGGDAVRASWRETESGDGIRGSAVLFMLTRLPVEFSQKSELCLLLNKRSRHVLQPGDLCCPGGGLQTTDKFLSLLMNLPFSPLHQWGRWTRWRARDPRLARRIAVLMTTGLREAWEEMRLNPLAVSFLGPLAVQQLVVFERRIYPLVAWVPVYPRLKPNWEVERILHVPLRQLLDPKNYGCYRLTFKAGEESAPRRGDYPCFIHRGRQGTDILWGATFRITMDFLERVFGFRMPAMEELPVVKGRRGTTYLNGSVWSTGKHHEKAHSAK